MCLVSVIRWCCPDPTGSSYHIFMFSVLYLNRGWSDSNNACNWSPTHVQQSCSRRNDRNRSKLMFKYLVSRRIPKSLLGQSLYLAFQNVRKQMVAKEREKKKRMMAKPWSLHLIRILKWNVGVVVLENFESLHAVLWYFHLSNKNIVLVYMFCYGSRLILLLLVSRTSFPAHRVVCNKVVPFAQKLPPA